MIGPPQDNPDEVYRTACGKWFGRWAVALYHEATCPECGAVKYGEPECDADDRGICYERD